MKEQTNVLPKRKTIDSELQDVQARKSEEELRTCLGTPHNPVLVTPDNLADVFATHTSMLGIAPTAHDAEPVFQLLESDMLWGEIQRNMPTPADLMARLEASGANKSEEASFALELALAFGFKTDEDLTTVTATNEQLYALMKCLGYKHNPCTKADEFNDGAQWG